MALCLLTEVLFCSGSSEMSGEASVQHPPQESSHTNVQINDNMEFKQRWDSTPSKKNEAVPFSQVGVSI